MARRVEVSDFVPMRDLPRHLDMLAAQKLGLFSVNLMQLVKNVGLRIIGSGTLVQISEYYYILTAGHVWEKIDNLYEKHPSFQINFGITHRGGSDFRIPAAAMHASLLYDAKNRGYGPDLALLRIPPNKVGTFKSTRSFLNFCNQRAIYKNDDPPLNMQSWFGIFGVLGETSSPRPLNEGAEIWTTADARLFLSGPDEINRFGSHDYLDIGVDVNLDGVPASFGGVSGGGLWQLDLRRDAEGSIFWDERPILRGVAYLETPVVADRREVRCHGPESIYTAAWDAWDLPRADTE